MNREPSTSPQHWSAVGNTGAVTRRLEFENYQATSAFLDGVNALSEELELYPDLGFASTYVNVTIPPGEQGETDLRDRFAERANAIFAGSKS